MGRFYKTTMPTYENFVNEIPYELMGLALAKKEQDLANTEQGLLNANQGLSQLKTKARTQDSPVLEEKISAYQKIIDDATQKLVSNPGEYRNTSRQLKQVSAQLQNEMNNGDIGKIVREYDHYQNYLKSAAEKRDLLLKSGKGDNVLIGQEYERMVAKENEEYKGYKESARGGNFSKWDIHGTDFSTEADKIISKISPTKQDWEKLENFASAKITSSGSSEKVSDNIIMQAIYDFIQTPTGQAVIARDVDLDRYSIEDLNSIFVTDKQGNIILNPDPKTQNAFKAIASVLIAKNKQNKTTYKRDETQWSKTGEKALLETSKKLNTQFTNDYFINDIPLTVVNVDVTGNPYYGVTIGNKEYAVTPDILRKANTPGFKSKPKSATPPQINPTTNLPILDSEETTKYYHQTEIKAYDALLELLQTNQERNAQKQTGVEFYKESDNIIETVNELNTALRNQSIGVSNSQTLKYGGVVLPKFQNGGVIKGKSGSLYPNNIQTSQKKSTNTFQQTQQTVQPPQVITMFPAHNLTYSTPNKNYKDYISEVISLGNQLIKEKDDKADPNRIRMVQDAYENSSSALTALNTKLYEYMNKQVPDKVKNSKALSYYFHKNLGTESNYYNNNLDETIDVESFLAPIVATAHKKNIPIDSKELIQKSFFKTGDNGSIEPMVDGVFVDEEGKTRVTPETFIKFYEGVEEHGRLQASLENTAYNLPYKQNSSNYLARALTPTYTKLKKETKGKIEHVEQFVKHLDAIQNAETTTDLVLSFRDIEKQRTEQLIAQNGVDAHIADLNPLKEKIKGYLTDIGSSYSDVLLSEYMTKEKITPSEEGDYTLNNPFKSTNDKSAWESLAFFPITGLFSAALPFIINKKTGSDSGISTGKKNIKDVLKDIEINEVLITHRGVDLNVTFNGEEKMYTMPENINTALGLNLHNINPATQITNMVRDVYIESLQKAGVKDIFNPKFTLKGNEYDLTKPESFKGNSLVEEVATTRKQAIALTNRYLTQEILQKYKNLPLTTTNFETTESKTGVITNDKRYNNSTFLVTDPHANLKFKVVKTGDNIFTIFAKDYQDINFTKISEVEDNVLNIQEVIIRTSEAVKSSKTTKK